LGLKRHEAEKGARKRASQREKAARKAAEKAGRLNEYIRNKRKAKEASIRADAARILQKDKKKRAEHKREVAQAAQAKAEQMRKKSGLEDAKRTAKQREQSGLTEKEWKAKEAQQAIWDANGAAIYAANQEFEAAHGFQMNAPTREQAIKDATVGGVFNAGLYATNLQASAQQIKEDDPYASMEDYYKNQDRINAEMREEADEYLVNLKRERDKLFNLPYADIGAWIERQDRENKKI
jgi:hypothetical protein